MSILINFSQEITVPNPGGSAMFAYAIEVDESPEWDNGIAKVSVVAIWKYDSVKEQKYLRHSLNATNWMCINLRFVTSWGRL